MKRNNPDPEVIAATDATHGHLRKPPKYDASAHTYVSLQINHGDPRYRVLPLTLTKQEALDLSCLLAEKAAQLP